MFFETTWFVNFFFFKLKIPIFKNSEENNIKEVSQEFPKEEAKIQEKKKEKENLLGNKTRSNDYEITKDNTMVSTTCATKNGET